VEVVVPLEIAESIHGTWHYHLRTGPDTFKALCGAQVMPTSIPLEHWNKKIPNYHIPESFCSKCNEAKDDA